MGKNPLFSDSESKFLWNLFNVYYRCIKKGESNEGDWSKINRIYLLLLYDVYQRNHRKLEYPKWREHFDGSESEDVRYDLLGTYMEDKVLPAFLNGLKFWKILSKVSNSRAKKQLRLLQIRFDRLSLDEFSQKLSLN